MLSALRTRWLRIRRGWRIAIVAMLCTLAAIGGIGLVLYQRTALAREFDATLLGVVRLASIQNDQLALTDDQVRQVLVPLRRLEIQDSIQPDDAREALAELRAALTADQLKAIARAGALADGGLRSASRLPRLGAMRPGLASGANPGAPPATNNETGEPGGVRQRLGQRAWRRPGPLARLVALFRLQLPQPAFISQICQRLEDRLNGAAQTPTN